MFCTLYFICVINWCVAEGHNFLLIIVDDLRPALGSYGDEKAYTPNIDKLSTEGFTFNRAYAQQALCAPSRNSFLTSRRPDTLRLYDTHSYWRESVGNFTTLPQHLRSNGYITKAIGKVFHPGISSNHSDDYPYSWSEIPFHPFTERYKNVAVCRSNLTTEPMLNLVCPVDVSSMPNKTLPDIEIMQEAKRFLSNQAGNVTPFFLAVGFQKPHIPFKYPEGYLKYHPLQKFKIVEPYKWPKNVSSVAYNPWNDLRKRDDVAALNLRFPWQKIPKRFAKLIIQSYYASVTYIDDLIGELINQLEASSIRKNTTIILMSDHGWSLGEHAEWAKYSNYDVALKVPLIISIPSLSKREKRDSINKPASSYTPTVIPFLIELVDVFPTIADLANIPIPSCSKRNTEITCSEGSSLVPLIKAASNRTLLYKVRWKSAAFSQYPRPNIKPSMHPNSDQPCLKEIKAMGYTVRKYRYRYTAWLSFKAENKVPDWNSTIAEELYDYNNEDGENQNVAYLSKYAKVKGKLKSFLEKRWGRIFPTNKHN
ncbi:iduronate 2-sulfatase [Ceratina calcarata]|uniref:Iduronate 2-sulfatase n=1 Tax=Ceratina calcarata TaxID=156304 RepID=A0AAJ7ISE9_9HYME|nr:iduronate 2-sulfatase [Ceratina calcarata]